VSYQVNGTLGQRLQAGLRTVQTYSRDGKMEITNVKLSTHTIEGFSGHSDRNQLINYVRKMRPTPRRVFMVHGEESKTVNMARTISRMRGVKGFSPGMLETFLLA
jgi:predicted metal-dependent RNase